MTKDELMSLVGDEETVNSILEVSNDVTRYRHFRASVDLGIVYGPRDLTFTDMILFSWIANRKT
jgi:hypothetical protein